MRTILLLLPLALGAAPRQADVLIYGCTSGAVTAAIQTKKMGKSVVMVCPEKHLGGLTAGGLGYTDTGNKAVIGGLSREFYHRVWLEYEKPKTWRWQKREEFGGKGQGTAAVDAAKQLVEIRKVPAIIGDIISSVSIPVLTSVTAPAGVVQISPASSSPTTS